MRRLALSSLLIALACGGPAKPDAGKPAAATPNKAEPAAPANAEAPDAAKAKADGAQAKDPKDPTAAADKPKPEPLTEEDQKLLDADPKTLTPDERRKRAYALRKKIMSNPDSEAAKSIRDLQQAIESGEIQPPKLGSANAADNPAPVFHSKTAAAQEGGDAAPADK